MIEGVAIKRLKVVPDERGHLMECLRNDDDLFIKFGQMYMTTTLPGVVKGWHLHRVQWDNVVCVKGMIKLALYDAREGSATQGQVGEYFIGEHNPMLVRIPPGLYHGWKCVSTEEAYIVNAPTEVYDYAKPDQEELPQDSPLIPYHWGVKLR
jgi:dTDP-4-dehydrorhamnose 3,5-epimerase